MIEVLSEENFLRDDDDLISDERENTIAAQSIGNGTKMSGPDDKIWRPLNADLFEMKLKVNVKDGSQHRDAMTNRIGVLQNINTGRNAGSLEQGTDERKKVRSQERSGRA